MKKLLVGLRRKPSISRFAMIALAIALVGVAATASAQTVSKANFDFPFFVGAKECPAGAYTVQIEAGKVMLRSADPKGASAVSLVITRLGRHDKDTDAEFVFDKVANKVLLSEVWLPNEDGYLILSTPGAHEHRVVGGSNPHK